MRLDREMLRGPLGLSLACLVGIVVISLWLLIPLLSTLGSIGGGNPLDDGAYENLIASHDQAHRTDLNRIHGRSFFFEPPAPPRPKPPEPTGACCVDEECTVMRRDACRNRGGSFKGADTECSAEICIPQEPTKIADVPKVDPRPRSYAGPEMIAIYGSDVIFRSREGLLVIPVGQTLENIEVKSVDAPRSAELMWKEGGPFTVTLFERPETPFEDSGLKNVLTLPDSSPTRSVDEDRPERDTP